VGTAGGITATARSIGTGSWTELGDRRAAKLVLHQRPPPSGDATGVAIRTCSRISSSPAGTRSPWGSGVPRMPNPGASLVIHDHRTLTGGGCRSCQDWPWNNLGRWQADGAGGTLGPPG
jgi:hypothetical protein